MERRTKFNVFYVLFAVLAMLAVQEGWRRAQTIEVVPYSEFEKYLEEDRISEVTVSDQHITGKLKKPEGTIKADLYHARAKLKEALAEREARRATGPMPIQGRGNAAGTPGSEGRGKRRGLGRTDAS